VQGFYRPMKLKEVFATHDISITFNSRSKSVIDYIKAINRLYKHQESVKDVDPDIHSAVQSFSLCGCFKRKTGASDSDFLDILTSHPNYKKWFKLFSSIEEDIFWYGVDEIDFDSGASEYFLDAHNAFDLAGKLIGQEILNE
jgi:hypothetical protein